MDIVNIFKTLGDENRLRIINILLTGEYCVCELEKVLNLSQSNVSRHLIKLKNADIVEYSKKAQWIYYRMNEKFEKEYFLLVKYLKDSLPNLDMCKNDLEVLKKLQQEGLSCQSELLREMEES